MADIEMSAVKAAEEVADSFGWRMIDMNRSIELSEFLCDHFLMNAHEVGEKELSLVAFVTRDATRRFEALRDDIEKATVRVFPDTVVDYPVKQLAANLRERWGDGDSSHGGSDEALSAIMDAWSADSGT